MTLGITQKLLLAFIVTNGLIVILMVVGLRWNFGRGFRDYIHQTELRRLQAVVDAVETSYAEHDDWEFLRHQHHRWHELVRQSDPYAPSLPPPPHLRLHQSFRDGRHKPMDQEPVGRRPHRPPIDPTGFGPRLTLLAADQTPIVGRPGTPQNATLRPIRKDGELIGWVRLAHVETVTNEEDRRFMAQQSRGFFVIAGIAIAVAAVSSLVLARHFLAPVKDLAQGTRALIAGQLNARIAVSSRDELGQLSRDFNTLAYTLEQNEQMRRQLTADISHELRTPLAILQGEIEAMQDGVRDLDAANLRSLHAEALILNGLVNDLYELSMSDIGALTYRKAEIELPAIVDAALTTFQSRLAAQHVKLDLYHVHPSVRILGDPERLTQLLNNLFENTLRYTEPGGQLRVYTESDDDCVHLHIHDSAPGVPDDALPRLFDRLYRVESSRNRARGGTGLGLAICKHIVEAHEGQIEARHSPLGGLWLRITLPTVS